MLPLWLPLAVIIVFNLILQIFGVPTEALFPWAVLFRLNEDYFHLSIDSARPVHESVPLAEAAALAGGDEMGQGQGVAGVARSTPPAVPDTGMTTTTFIGAGAGAGAGSGANAATTPTGAAGASSAATGAPTTSNTAFAAGDVDSRSVIVAVTYTPSPGMCRCLAPSTPPEHNVTPTLHLPCTLLISPLNTLLTPTPPSPPFLRVRVASRS